MKRIFNILTVTALCLLLSPAITSPIKNLRCFPPGAISTVAFAQSANLPVATVLGEVRASNRVLGVILKKPVRIDLGRLALIDPNTAEGKIWARRSGDFVCDNIDNVNGAQIVLNHGVYEFDSVSVNSEEGQTYNVYGCFTVTWDDSLSGDGSSMRTVNLGYRIGRVTALPGKVSRPPRIVVP